MKTKEQKKEELKSLRDRLPNSQITIFTSFARAGEKGLSVSQMTELKRSLRAAQSEYVVTKKTLIDRATAANGVDVYAMNGSLGLVLGNEEPYSIAKRVYDFAKKNPALQFFGALLRPSFTKVSEGKQGSGGQALFIDKDHFIEMAKMPSKEVLIGRLLGMMKYPITGLTVVLNEISKKQQSAS